MQTQFVVTILGKMRHVQTALHGPAQAAEAQGDTGSQMRFLFNRFQLGLATSTECKDLAEHIASELMIDNEHARAGSRLWRDKEMVAHLDSKQLSLLLQRLEEGKILPYSHRSTHLVFALLPFRVHVDRLFSTP
eukprot:COSAG02_NODE_2703_length_8201_cov_9.957294_3_plen_134_part_00